MASIKALMVTEMVTAHPEESVAEVARRMSANKVGAVVLIDGGAVRGLFSERDLLTRVVGANRDLQATRVGTVATREVVTIDVDAPLKAVLQLFRDKKFRHLPVVHAGQPVGILSSRDFLEYLVDGLERYIDEVKYRDDLAEGVDPYDHIGGSYAR